MARPAVASTPKQGASAESASEDQAEQRRKEAETLLNASYGIINTKTKPTSKEDKAAHRAHRDMMSRVKVVVGDVGRNPLPDMKVEYARVLYGHVVDVDVSLTGMPYVEAMEEAITRYLANNPMSFCDPIYNDCHKPDSFVLADGPRLEQAVVTAAAWYPGAGHVWGRGKGPVDRGGRNSHTSTATRGA